MDEEENIEELKMRDEVHYKMYEAIGSVYNAGKGEPTAWGITNLGLSFTNLPENRYQRSMGRIDIAFHRNGDGTIVLDYFHGMDLCRHNDICHSCAYANRCWSFRQGCAQCNWFSFVPKWTRAGGRTEEFRPVVEGDDILVSYEFLSKNKRKDDNVDNLPGLEDYKFSGVKVMPEGLLLTNVKKKD